MDAELRGVDVQKIFAVLISLLEKQENVEITYMLERKEDDKTA